jgi:hypothetical protein
VDGARGAKAMVVIPLSISALGSSLSTVQHGVAPKKYNALLSIGSQQTFSASEEDIFSIC